MLLKGSFREAKFLTVDHELTPGRRQPTYSIPFSEDGAESVDIGREPDKYRIRCMVLGPNYRADRDELLDAFRAPGPGLLIHPEFGRVLVVVEGRSVSFSESTREQQKCTISFTAIEALDTQGLNRKPASTIGALVSAKQTGVIAARAAIVAGLPQPSISDFVRRAHLDFLDKAVQDLRVLNGQVSSVLSIPSGVSAQIDQIGLQLSSLIKTPSRLYDALQNVFDKTAEALNRVVTTTGTEVEVVEADFSVAVSPRSGTALGSQTQVVALAAALGSGLSDVPSTDTPERDEERAGRVAMQAALRGGMLMTLAAGAVDARYDSAAQAKAVRDALCDAMVALADSEPEIDSALALALRLTAARLARALGETVNLSTTHRIALPVPAEVLAYALYGDAERADEIIARNGIADPGGLPGGAALEVAKV